jgi:hypothetical protein
MKRSGFVAHFFCDVGRKGLRREKEFLASIHPRLGDARPYAPDPVSQGGAVERERVEQTGAQPMAHPPPVGAIVGIAVAVVCPFSFLFETLQIWRLSGHHFGSVSIIQ